MDKNFRTLLIWWMVLAICWLFLRIGTDIHKTRVINERLERANERASEREREFTRGASEREREFTRGASERASERARDLEKQREAFRKKWGEEPTF